MKLVIASLNYSSWSVRAWLALTQAGVEFETETVGLLVDEDWKAQILAHSPAGKVPILIDDELTVHESLAICEYAHELRPEAGLWPDDPIQRARARAVSAEMAAGFALLRENLPMNYRARVPDFAPDDATRAEIARAVQIWETCRGRATGGPYLFGRFGIADVMYLPVLSRFRTYGVEIHGVAAAYAEAMWSQSAVRRWVAEAERAPAIPHYDAITRECR
jgi:glutathione S-transferase